MAGEKFPSNEGRGDRKGRTTASSVSPTDFTAEVAFRHEGTIDPNNLKHSLRAYLPSVPGFSVDYTGSVHFDDQSYAPLNNPTQKSVNQAFTKAAIKNNALPAGSKLTKAGLANWISGQVESRGGYNHLGAAVAAGNSVNASVFDKAGAKAVPGGRLDSNSIRGKDFFPTKTVSRGAPLGVDRSVAAYERHLAEMRGDFKRQSGDPTRTSHSDPYNPFGGQREVLMKGPGGRSDILSPVGAMGQIRGGTNWGEYPSVSSLRSRGISMDAFDLHGGGSGAYTGGNFGLSNIALATAAGSGYFTHRNNPMLRQDNVSGATSHAIWDPGNRAWKDNSTGQILGTPSGRTARGFTPSINTTDYSTLFKLGNLQENVIPGDLARSRALSYGVRSGGTGSNLDNLVNLLNKTASSDSALGQLVAITKPGFSGATGSFSGQGLGSNAYQKSGGAQGPYSTFYGRQRDPGGDQGYGRPSLSGQNREGFPTSRWGAGNSFMGGAGNVAASQGGRGGGGGREVGPGGGAAKTGGFREQLTQQLGHAAAWQLYMPAIMGATYAVGKAMGGDPYTDRSVQQLIGVGADSERRDQAKKWGYKVTNAIPFSRPQHYIGAFKEAASGLGIPLNAKTQGGLQGAAEEAMTFSMFSMEEPGTAARRLSRATLMEANAKGVKTDEGKLAIHSRLSNNLANLYAASSTKGQEVDTAMHYFGPTALGHMKWGYDESAAFVSRYTEQGLAASTVGVFGRDLGSTEFMKKGVKARMYWEEFYKRGGKTREHLPVELEGARAWTMPTGKKPDPAKLERYKEMSYRQSEYNKIMRSGNRDAQIKLIGQISQDLYKLEVAGAGGNIRAPESIQPMIKAIATSGTIGEFVNQTKQDMGGVSADPAVRERADTNKLQVDSQAGALSILGNQFTSSLEGFGKATGITGLITRYGNVANATDATTAYMEAVKSGDQKGMEKALFDLQRMRNAGTLKQSDIDSVKGFFFQKSANHRGFDYVNAGGGKFGQSYVIDPKNTGGGIFGSPERKKIEENIIAAYERLNAAAGGNYLGSDNILPTSMQSPGMQKVTAEEAMKSGKKLADIIQDGHMKVTINAEQLKELSGAMGGRDNYSLTETGDGQYSLKIHEKSGPKKPQAPSAPPHNGMSPVTGQRYYWGEKPAGPPTIAENYTPGTAGANY